MNGQDPQRERLLLLAKAKMKLRSRSAPVETAPERTIGQNFSEPWQAAGVDIQTGQAKMDRGNLVAGGAQKLAGAAQAVLSPLSGIDQSLRQVAQKHGGFGTDVGIPAVLDLLGAIPKATGYVGKKLGQAGLGLVGGAIELAGGGHNLGTTPENAQDIREQVPKLTETVGSIVGPVMAPKAVRGVKDAVEYRKPYKAIATAEKSIETLKQKLPPTKSETNYTDNMRRAAEYLAPELKENPLNSAGAVRQMADVTAQTRAKMFDDYLAPITERIGDVPVAKMSARRAIRGAITETMRQHDPATVRALEQFAETFNKQDTFKGVLETIKEFNAEAQSFYKASPDAQYQIMSDPVRRSMIGAKIVAADALRDVMFDTAERFGEKGMKELRKDYGALRFAENVFTRNITRSEKVGGATGAGGRTPLGLTLATEALLMGLHYAPATTIPAGIVGFGKKYANYRNKTNPSVARAMNKLGKTGIEPPLPQTPDPRLQAQQRVATALAPSQNYSPTPPPPRLMLPQQAGGPFEMGRIGSTQPQGPMSVQSGGLPPGVPTQVPTLTPADIAALQQLLLSLQRRP